MKEIRLGPFVLSQHRELFSKLLCCAYNPQNKLCSNDASLITKNSSLIGQVLLQTAVMPFFNFSISPSFSFLEFSNYHETKLFQRIPTSAHKKSEVITSLLDLKQWRNMVILGFVRKLLSASELTLNTTCRELNFLRSAFFL